MTQQDRFRTGHAMQTAQLHRALINLSTWIGLLYQAVSVVINFKNRTIYYWDYDTLIIKSVLSSDIEQSSYVR